MKRQTATILLLIVTLIYGSSFIAMKVMTELNVTPAYLVLLRGIIFFIFTLFIMRDKLNKINRQFVMIGSIAGVLNFLVYFFQSIGIKYTTPSNNAFLTNFSAMLVPFITWMLYRTKPSKRCVVALPITLAGMVVLTGFDIRALAHLNKGDFYTLICAVFCGFLLSFLSNTGAKVDASIVAFMMAIWQCLGGLVVVAFERQPFPISVLTPTGLLTLLYLGAVCSFFATLLQIKAQKFTSATVTALTISLEGVFASVFSVMLGFEPSRSSLIIGGGLMVIAIIYIQVNFKTTRKQKELRYD